MAAPVSPSDGDYITRGFWKTEVTNRWSDLYASWTYFTPTWTASTTQPSLGNGTFVGAYLQVGQAVFFRMRLQFGSSTTPGTGSWSFSLPTGLAPAFIQVAQGFVASADGVTRWPMSGYLTTANGVERMGVSNNIVGGAVPLTWGAGDQIVLTGCYET
ncbi:hypothetical protein ACIBI0_38460 [Microbispora rosea]|uniref:hypothetical protein n=1 Tax=Microbispora rosea TaxID=58117 RepID=UPI0037895D78